jgi:hypothetical protein
MPHAEIDLDIVEKLELLGLSEDAINLQVRAILWCNKNLTDGRLPKTKLGALTAKANAKKLAAELVTAGRWIDSGAFWELHDYLKHNRSRELGGRAEGRPRDLHAQLAEGEGAGEHLVKVSRSIHVKRHKGSH